MNLRSLRVEKGYTIQQVADGTGLPKTSIGYWESGERQPAADVLPKLAGFYGITTDELLGYKSPNLPAAEEPEEVFEGIRGKDEVWGVCIRYLTSNLSTIEKSINKDLLDVKKTFFKIGYKLHLISKYRLYNPLGYESIIDYAEDKFGFGKSTTYNFMQVYNRISANDNPTEIRKEYLPYNYSQLVEMSKENIWARDDLLSVIKPTDSVKQIHDYVALWNRSYSKHGIHPQGATVKEALAIAAEEKAAKEKAEKLPQPSEENYDVPPGQMSIFDEEESERPFDEPQAEFPEEPHEETENEFGEQEFEDVGESYSTPGLSMAFVNMAEESDDLPEEKKEYSAPIVEIVSDKLTLKNDTERKEFLRKTENFNIPVLRNAELGLEITKRVLRNGAMIYRTTYLGWQYGDKEPCESVSLCLVDPKEEITYHWSSIPQKPYKSYTLSGTAETYIVQYLSKHKDEI